MYDQLQCRRDLLTDCLHRHVLHSHQTHRRQAFHHIGRRVAVAARQRTSVACVHGLQHVDCRLIPDFPYDDAVRTHYEIVNK